jgi:hypothetical protein
VRADEGLIWLVWELVKMMVEVLNGRGEDEGDDW